MLINKVGLVSLGVDASTAANYIKMLNRRMPSTTFKKTSKLRKNLYFDLDYAITMCDEMINTKYSYALIDDWIALKETLLIAKENLNELPTVNVI